MSEIEVTVGGVAPDPDDNEGMHVVPHHESGTRISFEVENVGDAGGKAEIRVELDGVFASSWSSDFLDRGQQQAGFVNLGRLKAGDNTAFVVVEPWV